MRRIRVTQSNLEDRQKCEDELDTAVKRAKEARELAPPPHPTRDEMGRRWRKGKHLADDAAAGAPSHQPPADEPEPAAIEGPHGVFDPRLPLKDGAAAEEEHLDYFDEDEPGPSREGIAPLGALLQDDSQEVNEHGFTPTEDKMSTDILQRLERERVAERHRWLECRSCHKMRRVSPRQADGWVQQGEETNFRCDMIAGLRCKMPQQRGSPIDPPTNVAAFTRAQVLPKQIARSLRHIFAQWTDLDSQLYLYDTDTKHPGRSATAHYQDVYD